MEVHLHRFDTEARSRHLGAHAKGYPLIRLDADHEHVVIDGFPGRFEEHGWDAFKVNGDFGAAFGEAFADANKEGDTCPAPVVHIHLKGDVGFRGGLRVDIEFVAIGGDALAVDGSRAVLAADDVFENILTGERSE